MKVIITKKFENNLLKTFKKYFQINDLVKILKEKSHIFISLHDPFYKLKTKINLVEFIGVLVVINKDKIIPLFIYLKKDKRNGININWKEYEKLIESEYEMITKEIESGDYVIY